MKSAIHTTQVRHERLSPIHHAFMYRLFFFEIDLDELDQIEENVWLFAHNRFSVFSIFDADYLTNEEGSIREKLEAYLARYGIDQPIERVKLLTVPRYFGYVFNPVSFYYCYDSHDQLMLIVAEVNNTYGEKHIYLVNTQKKVEGQLIEYVNPKEFYVSPFNDMNGDYEFRCADLRNALEVNINILRSGEAAFLSRLTGCKRFQLRSSTVMKVALQGPLTPWLSMPRILWQAANLYFRKHLPYRSRPNPSSPHTIRNAPPKWSEQIYMKMVFSILKSIQYGTVTFELPDRGPVSFVGKKQAMPKVSLRVVNYDFFRRLVLANDVGLGEAFTAGDFETDNLPELLSVMAMNWKTVDPKKLKFGYFKRLLNFLEHRSRKNTLEGSKSNIKAHYDLSNSMFQLFLDKSMTYSCAYFDKPDTSLGEAQRSKLRSIIEKANIKEGDHVLEIGCGWGSFALEAVQRTGCRMTCLTLSDEQQHFFRERVQQLGLENQIEIRNQDYRHIEGKFDKIVSIEMLEAVGEEYIPEFFRCCQKLLKPDGRLVIQVITMPHEWIPSYRVGCDWIQKYIFPGCFVPSLEMVQDAASRASSLVVREVDSIGLHYATTLARWRERFLNKGEQIKAQGFSDEFLRQWEYYFGYCEAGFSTRYLDTCQIVFENSFSRRS